MLPTAYIVFIILCLAGLIWSAFSGMGTLLIFIGAFFIGWVTDFQIINIAVLTILLSLFVLGELLEYLLVLWGAEKFGASKKAAWGALIGGILGGFIGLFLGAVGVFPMILLGIFLGGFLVELENRKDVKQALKSGAGGIFGRFGAVLTKVFITLVMITIVVYNILGRINA